jgi:hypothetical protein
VEYPVIKKDYLGRIIYIKWNDSLRIVNKYYGETNTIKIKYRYLNEDVHLEIFDKNNHTIGSYQMNNFFFEIGGKIKIRKNKLVFIVENSLLKQWNILLKTKN